MSEIAIVGTCNFKDSLSANKYYSSQGFDAEAVLEKIRTKEIVIGAPKVPVDHIAELDRDNRYYLVYKPSKCIAKDGTKNKYLLGTLDGVEYWLVVASWDCGWYWGFGYISTKDSHSHFDGEWFQQRGSRDYYHRLSDKPGFVSTLTDSEEWRLGELMRTFYTLKEAADLFNRGGSGVTTNPLQELIKDKTLTDKINKELLPKVFDEVYSILTPVKEV